MPAPPHTQGVSARPSCGLHRQVAEEAADGAAHAARLAELEAEIRALKAAAHQAEEQRRQLEEEQLRRDAEARRAVRDLRGEILCLRGRFGDAVHDVDALTAVLAHLELQDGAPPESHYLATYAPPTPARASGGSGWAAGLCGASLSPWAVRAHGA